MIQKNPYLKKATGTVKAPVPIDRKRHLGRGLDGLLSGAKAQPQMTVAAPVAVPRADSAAERLELPVKAIERSPYQPRRDFKEEELAELAESLKNTGLIQPPVVRRNEKGAWELISGERRLRAAQLAGWAKIEVVVKNVDNLTAASMAATENIQREDLNPIEEAMSYKTLQDLFNLTQADVADRVGRGRATVANAVRLLELPDEVKALVEQKLLSVGHAKVLLSLDDEKERILLARDCVNDQLSVRALEKKVVRLHAPVSERPRATPDLPDSYVRNLSEKLKRHLGCAVRVTSGSTHPSGKRTKGVMEIDFYDNDDLDRIIRMIGVTVD